jgi:hypothetical protein
MIIYLKFGNVVAFLLGKILLLILYNRNLADIRKNGYLDETEFIVAMHYIAKLMDKSLATLPSILPPDVFLAASNSIGATPILASSPQPILSPVLQQRAKKIDTIGNMAFNNPAAGSWDVTAHEKAQYDTFFTELDKQGKGLIGGAKAVEFFKNSKLPDTDLAKIWDLADIGGTGTLNRDEFAIAMHLIHARLTGGNLPMVLPNTLVPPPTPAMPRSSNPTSPTTSTSGSGFFSTHPPPPPPIAAPVINRGKYMQIVGIWHFRTNQSV